MKFVIKKILGSGSGIYLRFNPKVEVTKKVLQILLMYSSIQK